MIKTSNLSKKFGTKYVLKNITIEIKKGRNLGIVGKNGAGKTTLMNLLIGINNQTSGEVEYDFHKKDINKIIGVQMQGGFFEPSLKVKEICKLYCALYNIPYSKVIEIMEKLEISNIQNLNLTKLSGGESQKMNILLAVLHNPEVLFFDELTTGLDAISRSNIYDDMKRLKKNGKTIILVSHYFEEIWSLCDDILILKNGETQFYGDVRKLANDYETFSKKILKIL